MELDAGKGTFVFAVPLSEDIRDIVDIVRSAYSGVDFRSKRERDVSVDGPSTMANRLEADLTDRQYEILQTALLSGYFEWPRDSTAEDVADRIGLTSSTVQYHLRNAERTLLTAVFDRTE